MKERAQADVPLWLYLLKTVPLTILGGALAGLLSALADPAREVIPTVLWFGTLGFTLGMPILVLKWWAARRPTDLTVQQQYFLAMDSGVFRLGVSVFLAVAVFLSLAVQGDLDGAVGWMLPMVALIVYCVMWAFARVIRSMGLMPPPQSEDLNK